MEALSFFLGIIGNITSLLVFLSPIGTFVRILKNRSTEAFESEPYICALLSSSLWTYYGIMKSDAFLLATVNGFGIAVETVYVGFFLLFAPPKMKAKTAVFLGILNIAFPVAAVIVSTMALQGKLRIDFIGFLCAGLNIIMYASPLTSMRMVVTTRSVEYMPFCLSFFLFLSGGVWAFYGFLIHDYFVLVPNGTGFMLGIVQLVIYAIFRDDKPSKCSVGGLEEGWQHEHLILPSDKNSET